MMDIRSELRNEDRVDIQFGRVQYRFKIVEISSADTFVAVHLGGRPIPDKYEEGLVLPVYGYMGTGHVAFDAKLVRRGFAVQKMQAMEFQVVSELEKVQRRSTYRLPINFPLKFLVLSRDSHTGRRVWRNAMAVNLGEGGIMMAAGEGYALGTEMQLRFAIDGRHLLINGIVRRSDYDVTPAGGLNFIMGLEFTSGNMDAKKHISKFVMQCQINNRNRVQ